MKKLTQKIILDDDEELVLVTRKHWFILFSRIFIPVLLLTTPLVISFVELPPAFSEMVYPEGLPWFLGALFALFLWMLIFQIWTDYYLDMWVVTSKRIIAIDQRGLFYRSISSFRFERLQDITVEINGIIATILDFGTIEAETAGHGETEFSFRGAPHPRELKSKIIQASDLLDRRSP